MVPSSRACSDLDGAIRVESALDHPGSEPTRTLRVLRRRRIVGATRTVRADASPPGAYWQARLAVDDSASAVDERGVDSRRHDCVVSRRRRVHGLAGQRCAPQHPTPATVAGRSLHRVWLQPDGQYERTMPGMRLSDYDSLGGGVSSRVAMVHVDTRRCSRSLGWSILRPVPHDGMPAHPTVRAWIAPGGGL
jgi:hypothetical protein